MIDSKAIVKIGAKIHPSSEIGPFSCIGANVKIASGVKIHSHVCIDGMTYIGESTEVFPFSAIGLPPQDLKYNGEKSVVVIGKNNKIREYCTINTGTKQGNMATKIGNNCLFMTGSHIAHDCTIGNNVVLANNATLGGHVILDNNVIIGGLAAVHQFVRIGQFSIVGGVSAVVENVAPFVSVAGDRAKIVGINITGMKRNNFSKKSIGIIKNVFKEVFSKNYDKNFNEKVILINDNYHYREAKEIVDFFKINNKRGFCMPKNKWKLHDQ